ncbi:MULTISPECIES: cytochrome c-type biogenesis protein [unclassified Archaeoglobus]|jgi:cytochrome c-type biogenesis protein CcmH|uniref:cytochrome c-type biogenesis protein n=1 Tax=unclassified Archaeoglobus TaxID=2643606 RepID=UPI0025BC87B4|nr:MULTISPECIES: cytochrome c-type biogenesis protein CcmH [unclassified Archaeoglobus]
MRAKIILTLLLLTLKASGLTLQDVEGDIICTCGCGKLLKNCDCGAAEKMREEISAMIEEGKNREEIVSALQQVYGKEVLATPPKEGFFLSLWIYPAIVLIAGSVIVYMILQKKSSEWFGDPDENVNIEEEVK